MSCAQEKLEISELKLGDSINTITDVHKNYIKHDWLLSKEEIKCYIYEKDIDLTYKGVSLKGCAVYTWKGKISLIDFSIKSFENQEKIIALLEKKYGNMKPDFGNCSKEDLVCWLHYENDNVYISFPRLVEKQFQIKGARTNVQISEKKFDKEMSRLEVENSKKLEKEALERKEKYK